jgi:histone H3/H4
MPSRKSAGTRRSISKKKREVNLKKGKYPSLKHYVRKAADLTYNVGISKDVAEFLEDIVWNVARRIGDNANREASGGGKNTIQIGDVATGIQMMFKQHLLASLMEGGSIAVNKVTSYDGIRKRTQDIYGGTLPTSVFADFLRARYGKKVAKTAAIFFCSIIDIIMLTIIDYAKFYRSKPSSRLSIRHITEAIDNDEALSAIFSK